MSIIGKSKITIIVNVVFKCSYNFAKSYKKKIIIRKKLLTRPRFENIPTAAL